MNRKDSTWTYETFEDISRFGIRTDRILVDERSEFQHIKVFENEYYGRVLMLDGIYQTSEADEYIYHEMLVHPALCRIEKPSRILLIGGGDGGTAREILRYDEVEELVMVEIDRKVVEVCRKFIPSIGASAWQDKRLNLQFADGIEYVAKSPAACFDAIFLDGSDPVGPAEGLFTTEFYGNCKRLLKNGGVFALQSESFFLMERVFYELQSTIRSIFPSVQTCMASVPIYGCGFWTWTLAGDDVSPERFDRERAATMEKGCKFFTAALARSSFNLPAGVQRKITGH